jgi:hypothetical protein
VSGRLRVAPNRFSQGVRLEHLDLVGFNGGERVDRSDQVLPPDIGDSLEIRRITFDTGVAQFDRVSAIDAKVVWRPRRQVGDLA